MFQFVLNFITYVSAIFLFELVYSWERYRKNKKGEPFGDTV